MDGYRCGRVALAVVGLLGLSGAGCPQMVTQLAPPPRVLPPSPSLEQVIQAVHRNSSQIQSFSSNTATISGPGWPTLRANLAFQRPCLFRLRADTTLTGAEVDVGSNDQLFWFWVRRDQPPGLYFCRHDQFATSRARQMIPLDPYWLIEALGMAEFDPALPHQGPYQAPNNRLQIRTIRETPEGPTTKITMIDAASAWMMEQYVYDPKGQLKASSMAEGYHRDPLTGLFIPSVVRINYPTAQFSMRLDLGKVEVNRLLGNPAELWTMPNYPGSPLVDLGNPQLQPPAAALPPAVSATQP